MAEPNNYEVFISYSLKDKPWAAEFASALKDSGVTTLFDVAELSPGDRWQDRIQQALRSSRTLVIILSKNSAHNPWTFFELGAALADHKRIIPVVSEDVGPETLAPFLKFQYLKESSPQEAGRRVADAIARDSLSN